MKPEVLNSVFNTTKEKESKGKVGRKADQTDDGREGRTVRIE